MAQLRIPERVINTDDEEYINTWRSMLALLAGTGTGGATLKNLFDANTILKADTDNTPEALTVGEDTIVGRQTGGEIAALTAAQAKSLLAILGSDISVSGFTGFLTGDTDVQSAFNTIDDLAASFGGLIREAVDTADGTAEHLQVTATSTPSSIRRMECRFRSIVPEIDNEELTITAIDEDDTEITSAVYSFEGFIKTSGGGLTGSSGSGTSGFTIGSIGNAANEYFDIEIRLTSRNGSQTQKHFWFFNTYTLNTGALRTIGDSFAVQTSKSIKGFRIDTNNSGDMISEGIGELWIQT